MYFKEFFRRSLTWSDLLGKGSRELFPAKRMPALPRNNHEIKQQKTLKTVVLSEAHNILLIILGTCVLLKKVPRYHYFIINKKESPLKRHDSF